VQRIPKRIHTHRERSFVVTTSDAFFFGSEQPLEAALRCVLYSLAHILFALRASSTARGNTNTRLGLDEVEQGPRSTACCRASSSWSLVYDLFVRLWSTSENESEPSRVYLLVYNIQRFGTTAVRFYFCLSFLFISAIYAVAGAAFWKCGLM
jgi:hypothetical protein